MHPAAVRRLLANVIAREKSYDVPGICSAIGLASGEESEAFNSKFRYANRRLNAIDAENLNLIAKRLNDLVESPDLSEYACSLENCAPSDEPHLASLLLLQDRRISERWSNALERRESDPEGAITLARTLLEDVCKSILHKLDPDFDETDDLPKLYRKTSIFLDLAPDQHTEQVFKTILGSCQSVVQSLGSLRNKLSDAHSSGPFRARPTARHAKLAVNLAGAMASFLAETYLEKHT